MFFKKKYKYVFAVIPLMILFRPFLFFCGKNEVNEPVASTFLTNMFGGSYGRDKVEITLAVQSLAAITIIIILLSDYISGDIKENGEYIFTRLINKKVWYLKKCINMFFYCLMGVVITVVPYAVMSAVTSQQSLRKTDIAVILQTIIMLSVFSFFCCQVINVISMKIDVNVAVLIMYSIIAVSLIIVYAAQSIKNKYIAMNILKFNIISNVVVSWNFSQSFVLWGMFYFICINILIFIVGSKVVENIEIGIRRRE